MSKFNSLQDKIEAIELKKVGSFSFFYPPANFYNLNFFFSIFPIVTENDTRIN